MIKLSCHKCSKWPKAQQELKGCLGPTKIPLFTLSSGENIYECPGRLIDEKVRMFFKMLGLCERFNCLPATGALMEQTISFVHCIGIVSKIQADKIAEEREKEDHASK